MNSFARANVSNAEQKARELLRETRQFEAHTNVDLICKFIGVDLVKEELEDDLSGMSFCGNNKRYVIVNSCHHVNRRRFTIAHEIGHHILHHDYLTRNIHVDTSVLNRDMTASNGTDALEIEANAFAAELLMPRALMKPYLGIEIADEIATKQAAQTFKVSQSAFTYRLLNLGTRG